MKKWKLVIPIAAVAAFLAWYAFRPERLVVNRRVDEAMPAAQGSSSPQPLVSGQFYSILHPTAGTATIYRMGDGSRVLRFTDFTTSNGPDVHVYMVACRRCKGQRQRAARGFHRSGDHQGQYRRPKLYPWSRSGPVEISRGFSVVQTIQRQFWCCSIDARPSGVGEVARIWPVAAAFEA